MVLASELAPVAEVLAKALNPSESDPVDCLALIEKTQRLLQEQLPVALPPLEAFEIEEVKEQEDTDGQ